MSEAVRSVGEYIRQQRETAKYSVRQLAALAGVSNPYLSQIERGLRRPSAEILQQLAKALRISAEALYVQAGILEERPEGDVPEAVRNDPHLDDRQRAVILEVYEAFRRENAALAAADDETSAPPANGAPANGAPANGAPANGAPANGAPANGAPANGAPAGADGDDPVADTP